MEQAHALQEAVLKLLNEALALDPAAVSALVANRVPCNKALADHPTIQVGGREGVLTFGVLGLVNGLFPTGPRIAAVYQDASKQGGVLGPVSEFRLFQAEEFQS